MRSPTPLTPKRRQVAPPVVLLQFLLAAADKPRKTMSSSEPTAVSVFYDATTVWAVMNRKALATALRDL